MNYSICTPSARTSIDSSPTSMLDARLVGFWSVPPRWTVRSYVLGAES